MTALTARRSFVLLAATAALAGGLLVVNAAAGWVADAASLDQPPPNATELVTQLQGEQAYAASLTRQLAQVAARAAELENALMTARDKAKVDAASAASLTAELAKAQAQLAALKSQGARTAAAPPPATTTSSVSPPTGEVDDD